MPHFLTQVAYTEQAWQSLVSNPQNHLDAIRPVIEKLGGRVVNAYFAFGDYDFVLITELPNNVSAAALAIAASAGGACKSIKTTSAYGRCRRPRSPSEGGYLRVSRSNGPNRNGIVREDLTLAPLTENQGHPSMIGMPFSFNALWFRVPPSQLLEQRAVAGSVRTGTLACPA